MATPKYYEQQMEYHFFAMIAAALAIPLLCIAPIVMLDGESGLYLAMGGLVIGFAVIFYCAGAGSQISKRLGKLPIKDRFWQAEYDGQFAEEEFLVAPLVGYNATRIQLHDVDGNVVAEIPRHTRKPLKPVGFEINGQQFEIRRTSNHTTRRIDIRPVGSEEPLISCSSPNRIKASFEINVADKMRIQVTPEAGKMFPTRSMLQVNGDVVGMVHSHERIMFKGIVMFLPTDWPQDLRLLLATFFWCDGGR